jgi:hypothetical protein
MMEDWYLLIFLAFMLALMLAGLAFAGRKVWQIGRRGWKDQVWIWSDANRAARFVFFIIGAQIVVRWAWSGMSGLITVFLIMGAVIIPIPYAAYIIGRLLGIRDRARNGIRLS